MLYYGKMPILKEVELRFYISKKEISKILKIFNEYDAVEVYEEDSYFCLSKYICKEYNTSKKTPYILRLRKSNKGYFFTFKRFTKNKTGWIEEECKIDNIKSIKKILQNIGYKMFLSIKKKRRFFSYDNILINLDYIEKLGCFLEFEIHSNDISIAKKKMMNIAKNIFNINIKNKIEIGYVQLMEKYLQGDKLNDN